MNIAAFLLVLLAAAGTAHTPANYEAKNPQSINAVLGDISFVNAFGVQPDASTDNNLRIRTHLAYVESLLRERGTPHLSPALRERRAAMLDLLHEYRVAGVFPKNYDYRNQHRPCFIDRDGRICAVGYLVEKSTGRNVAEGINARYKYAYITEMNAPDIREWIAQSGLTLEECAMIQPAYGWEPYPLTDSLPVSYGIGSALLGGLSVSVNAINGVQMLNGSDDKIIPLVGMATGVGQILLGALNTSEGHNNESGLWVQASREKNLVSYVNIGMGTATLLMSTWNFFSGNSAPADPSPINWNLHTVPAPNDGLGIGLTVNGRL